MPLKIQKLMQDSAALNSYDFQNSVKNGFKRQCENQNLRIRYFVTGPDPWRYTVYRYRYQGYKKYLRYLNFCQVLKFPTWFNKNNKILKT